MEQNNEIHSTINLHDIMMMVICL